jgi:hypothetical protein
MPRTRKSLMASDHLPLVANFRIGERPADGHFWASHRSGRLLLPSSAHEVGGSKAGPGIRLFLAAGPSMAVICGYQDAPARRRRGQDFSP